VSTLALAKHASANVESGKKRLQAMD